MKKSIWKGREKKHFYSFHSFQDFFSFFLKELSWLSPTFAYVFSCEWLRLHNLCNLSTMEHFQFKLKPSYKINMLQREIRLDFFQSLTRTWQCESQHEIFKTVHRHQHERRNILKQKSLNFNITFGMIIFMLAWLLIFEYYIRCKGIWQCKSILTVGKKIKIYSKPTKQHSLQSRDIFSWNFWK